MILLIIDLAITDKSDSSDYLITDYCLLFTDYSDSILLIKMANQQNAVSYFWQFRKDHSRPYGLVHNESTLVEDHLKATLKPKTCEFLSRPAVAFSELSETLTSNITYVNENLDLITDLAEILQKS